MGRSKRTDFLSPDQRGLSATGCLPPGLRASRATRLYRHAPIEPDGRMHNRVRMVVASFLVKDLRIDWQSGRALFHGTPVDGDLAANNGQLAMVRPWTGTDAMQGYRIFNPRIQSEKFDAEGISSPLCPGTQARAHEMDSRAASHAAAGNRCRPDAASDRIIRSRSWTIGKRARNIDPRKGR